VRSNLETLTTCHTTHNRLVCIAFQHAPFNAAFRADIGLFRKDCSYFHLAPNGLRYLRWGGDGEAVKTETAHSVDKAYKLRRFHSVKVALC